MYREKKKRSAIPVWGFGAVWLCWCLFGPMYRLWHLLACAALSAAAYALLAWKFPPQIVREECEPDTGDDALDQTLRQGRAAMKKMRALNDAIPDHALSRQIDELETLAGQIFAEVERDAKKLPQIRRFLNYYLPTTLQLLERYAHLQNAGTGDNVRQAMDKIRQLLDQVVVAFRRQLDALFASEVVDITAEIAVMEQMLKAQGLTEKQDF